MKNVIRMNQSPQYLIITTNLISKIKVKEYLTKFPLFSSKFFMNIFMKNVNIFK